MNIRTYSYRFADEILSAPGYCDIKDEILDICCGCPIPVYPGKSARQPQKDVVQQIMNTYFRLQFDAYGWEVEPLATPDYYEDALRADFRKTFDFRDRGPITAQIEVEFGNVASSYRNYFKFQLSFAYGLTDICVLIVPSYDLAIHLQLLKPKRSLLCLLQNEYAFIVPEALHLARIKPQSKLAKRLPLRGAFK